MRNVRLHRHMTTLYRSPTIVIAEHEWHLCVEKLGGRIYRRYKFRPMPARRGTHLWHKADAWKGRPFKLWRDFGPYIGHAKAAERYERDRLVATFRAEMRAVK